MLVFEEHVLSMWSLGSNVGLMAEKGILAVYLFARFFQSTTKQKYVRFQSLVDSLR